MNEVQLMPDECLPQLLRVAKESVMKKATILHRSDCSVCVHGYDLNPSEGSRVVCAPQMDVHDPHYRCTGFRRITINEIHERTSAMFGEPT